VLNERMDPNLTLLLILLGVATVVGIVIILAQSSRVRRHGLLGALRRKFSGGSHRSNYGD
jgi:hypothetical protein